MERLEIEKISLVANEPTTQMSRHKILEIFVTIIQIISSVLFIVNYVDDEFVNFSERCIYITFSLATLILLNVKSIMTIENTKNMNFKFPYLILSIAFVVPVLLPYEYFYDSSYNIEDKTDDRAVTKSLIGFIIIFMVLSAWISATEFVSLLKVYKDISNRKKALCYPLASTSTISVFSNEDLITFIHEHNVRIKNIQILISCELVLTITSTYCFLIDLQYFGFACPVHLTLLLSNAILVFIDFFTSKTYFKHIEIIYNTEQINNNGKMSLEIISTSGYFAILISLSFALFKAVF